MAILLGAGQRYDRVIGVGGITTSIDGYIWSDSDAITEPFPPGMKAQGVAVNGDGNVIVSVSDNGWGATSYDNGATWQSQRMLDADYSPLSVSWGENGSTARPVFAAAGSRHYNDDNVLPGEYENNAQIGIVMINESGSPFTWDEAFTHPENNSWFHNVKYFDSVNVGGISSNVWIAVGHVDGRPDIWYTENIRWTIADPAVPDPYTWQRVTIPEQLVDRPFYDVAFYQGTLYFSGRGVIANMSDLAEPIWDISQYITTTYASADFKSIAVNQNGHMVACASGGILWTTDRVGWYLQDTHGYFPQTAIWFADHWIVGAYSLLTQYTYYTSTDTKTWTPRNNLVQMYGMCVY